MCPNWVPYVHMAHPNRTKYKGPWSYPLSTPVEGVDNTVDFRSNLGGFDESGDPRVSEPHQNLVGLLVSYYMPGYHRWTLHGECAPRRKKVARQRTEEASTTFDTGADRMLDQFANAHAPKILPEDVDGEMDKSTKEFYDTLFASQKTLHAHTKVSQLDSISRLMAVKCQYNVSINAFDALLHVIGSLLPEH